MNDKKLLLKSYKETFRPPGVVIIRNLANGKIFIDASLEADKLINRHRYELKTGGHKNLTLQADWDKHGSENFSFEVLERIEQKTALDFNYKHVLKTSKEAWLDKLQPFGEKGYNE